MPHMEMIIGEGNGLLVRGRITELVDLEIPTTGPIPTETFAEVGIDLSDEQIAHLEQWPDGPRDVLRAALRSAIKRDPEPVPVTLAWMPAYDYEVTVSEARGVTGTTMTILLRGPYQKVGDSVVDPGPPDSA